MEEVNKYLSDYGESLQQYFPERFDEGTLTMLLMASAEYTTFARLGCADQFPEVLKTMLDDIARYNTVEQITAIVHASWHCSGVVLRQIEKVAIQEQEKKQTRDYIEQRKNRRPQRTQQRGQQPSQVEGQITMEGITVEPMVLPPEPVSKPVPAPVPQRREPTRERPNRRRPKQPKETPPKQEEAPKQEAAPPQRYEVRSESGNGTPFGVWDNQEKEFVKQDGLPMLFFHERHAALYLKSMTAQVEQPVQEAKKPEVTQTENPVPPVAPVATFAEPVIHIEYDTDWQKFDPYYLQQILEYEVDGKHRWTDLYDFIAVHREQTEQISYLKEHFGDVFTSLFAHDKSYIGFHGNNVGLEVWTGTYEKGDVRVTIPWAELAEKLSNEIEPLPIEMRQTQPVIEEVIAPLPELVMAEPMSRKQIQDAIDTALQEWNGSTESKRNVVRYMVEHGDEKGAANWLRQEYGDDLPRFPVVRAKRDVTWNVVKTSIIRLINEDRFLTEDEKELVPLEQDTEQVEEQVAEDAIPLTSGSIEPEAALNGGTRNEIEEAVLNYAEAILEEMDAADEVVIHGVRVYGSRTREGLYHEESDVDVVLSYSGELREDDFFNRLHEEEWQFGDLVVDINPISTSKSGTLEEYLARAEAYLDEKEAELAAEQNPSIIMSTAVEEALGRTELSSKTVPAEVVDAILRLGSNQRDSVLRIVGRHILSDPTFVDFIKEDFKVKTPGGRGVIVNDLRYAVWYDERGMSVTLGSRIFEKSPALRIANEVVPFTWDAVAARIAALIDAGQYAPQEIVEQAVSHQFTRAAEALWYMNSDKAENVNHYLPNEWFSGGFPDSTEQISKLLSQPAVLADTIKRVSDFAAFYRENPKVMRWKMYNPVAVLHQLEVLQHTPRVLPVAAAELPQTEHFITEDEIDDVVRFHGTAQYSLKFYSAVIHGADVSELAAMLKEHYGTGGSSHAISHADYSYLDYSFKGLLLRRGRKEVALNWQTVAKRVRDMVLEDRFLPPDAQAEMLNYEKNVLARQAFSLFYGCKKLESYPFKWSQEVYDNATDRIRPLLNDVGDTETLWDAMKEAVEISDLSLDRLKTYSGYITDMQDFLEGRYSLFTPNEEIVTEALLHGTQLYIPDVTPAVEVEAVSESPVEVEVVSESAIEEENVSESAVETDEPQDVVSNRVESVDIVDAADIVEHPYIGYQVGDTVYLDNKPFEITSISDLNDDVQLLDKTLLYPIFRVETEEHFINLLHRDKRNAHFLDYYYPSRNMITEDERDLLVGENGMIPYSMKLLLSHYLQQGMSNTDLAAELASQFARNAEAVELETGDTADYFASDIGVEFELHDKYDSKVSMLWSDTAEYIRTFYNAEEAGFVSKKPLNIFEYQNFHFQPVGVVDEKATIAELTPFLASKHEPYMSDYEDGKVPYDHEEFFAASGNSTADIFYCLETANVYMPGEHELFWYIGQYDPYFPHLHQKKQVEQPQEVTEPMIEVGILERGKVGTWSRLQALKCWTGKCFGI